MHIYMNGILYRVFGLPSTWFDRNKETFSRSFLDKYMIFLC